MSRGFLPLSKVASKAPKSTIAKCGACGLFKTCNTPKMQPRGGGLKEILIVAEAPTETDDLSGKPFRGETGRLLKRILRSIGVSLEEDCIVTYASICYSNKVKSKAAMPDLDGKQHKNWKKTSSEDSWKFCQPNLVKAIKDNEPKLIIPLGNTATRAVIDSVFKIGHTRSSAFFGYTIPEITYNAWICPTHSPKDLLGKKDSVLKLIFTRHLKAALVKLKTGRPWEKKPDYESQIDIIYDSEKAAKIINKMMQKGGKVAFDYETTSLKPEYEGAEIISCSICWEGKKTIAYPWTGKAIQATKDLLFSKNILKIASNLKFEDRWTQFFLGKSVVRWLWDTMIAAHTIDSSPGVTSIKFQAFVHLGCPTYNDNIEPFLKSPDKEHLNRIKQIDLRDLLLYNGMDSLLEFKVAMLQRKELK